MELTLNCRIEGPTSAFVDPMTIKKGTVTYVKLSGLNPGIAVRWDGESQDRVYSPSALSVSRWVIIE